MSTSTSLSVNKKGFTLVELLITISIIAILSAIGLIVYIDVLKQGRDSKRQSDLRSIQSGLEQYNNDQGFYPASISFGGTNSLTSSIGNPNPPASTKTYMNSVPDDSNTTYPYRYTALRDGATGCTNATTLTQCNSYCLYAKLDGSGTKPAVCTHQPTYTFAVRPP